MLKSYVSIDLETTGLNPKTDRIIEIGAIKVTEGEPEGFFSTFVNPGRRLDDRITELTGIRHEDLVGAPAIGEVLPELFAFLGDVPILGHSILFDFSFLKQAAANEKLPFEKLAVDTLKIARKYLPELESRSLDFLCNHYGIVHTAHRALEDAKATDLLYKRLAESFYNEGEELFVPKPLHYQAKKNTPATKAQKERLYRLVQVHKIDLGIEIESLTKSEASRLVDKIYFQYGRVV